MIKIQALDHIVLRANNACKLIEFYQTILNCPVERTLPELGLTQLRAGTALIDIVDVNLPLGQKRGADPNLFANNISQANSGPNVDHFCLTIDPIPAKDLIDYLDQHQIPHSDFENRYGAQGYGDSIYLEDPEGNGVELKFGLV